MNWSQLKVASIDDILTWASDQEWAKAMAACQQDSQWHAEGDVWTHTRMVCRQLPLLDEWPSLAPASKTILIFTALFHDAAKPLTTTVDSISGRLSSPRHAVRGEKLARSVLRELGCDLTTRESICKLVRFHGRPAFLSQREEPAHEVVRLSWLLSNRLLYLFALADTRGRKTDSTDRAEENLTYWKLVAQEHDCFEQPFPFETDHARFVFARSRQPSLHYVPHESFRCRVTLMSGLPAAGKDTWLRNHRPDLPVVSMDEVRSEMGIDPTANQGAVAQAARDACQKYLRERTSFAFNATNLIPQTRDRWIRLFDEYGAHIELVYLEPPMDRLLRQNSERQDGVPKEVITRLATKCEPPDRLDAHVLHMLESAADAGRDQSPGDLF